MVSQQQQKGALRGKERLQQLQEEFPEASRRQVVSTDLYREGLRANETSRRLGRWCQPDAPSYFDRNMENVFKESEKANGYYLNPFIGYFGDGPTFQFIFDSHSPYEVRYEEKGRYQLYRDGDPIEEVYFAARPPWYDWKTSSGRPMPSIASCQEAEGALRIAAMTYCEYGKDDLLCRYCNINPAESVNKETGIERQTAKREQDVYETMLAAYRDRKQTTIRISGGVILDPSKEADMYARLVRAIRRAEKDAGQEVPASIRIKAQAMEPEDVKKLDEAGLSVLGFNSEVWDRKLFEWICPGKAKYVGWERWHERLVKALEVMGKGRVVSSFVLGVEMAPPHGFKAEDEGAASYLEGWEWMLAHDIEPTGAMWRPAPGTIFEGMDPPRTEYFLRVQLARRKLNAKYGKAASAGG